MRGTIIDLETIGPFNRAYPPWDPRHYASVNPTIFGYLTGETLAQHCAENTEEIQEIIEIMRDTRPGLGQPFYALNCSFERCIIANTCRQRPPLPGHTGRQVPRLEAGYKATAGNSPPTATPSTATASAACTNGTKATTATA